MSHTVYCAEIEIYYSRHESDEEFVTYHVSGISKALRDKAIDRILEDGGEINFERYYTKSVSQVS